MGVTITFRVRWNANASTHADLDAAMCTALGLPPASGWVVERIETRGQVRPIARERADKPGSWDFLDQHGAPTEICDAGNCIWLNDGTVH